MVSDSKGNAGKCLCPTCPSFNECMKEKAERLYCGRVKTDCEVNSNGCVCRLVLFMRKMA